MNTAAFESGAKKAEGTLGRLKSFLIGPGGIAVAAAAVGAAFIKMSMGTFKAADEIYKASQSIGVGTEELSRLKYAADLSGISFEQLQKGIGILSKNMFAAASGSKAQAEAFASIGVEVKNADGTMKSTSETILMLADQFSKMEDGAAKTALAMKFLGRSGADMIPFLNQGREAVQALMEETDQFGFVVDEVSGKKAEEFNDSMRRLEGASGKLQRELSMMLLPTLADIAEGMVNAARNTSNFGNFFAVTMRQVQANIVATIPGLRLLLNLLQALRGPVATDPIAAGLGTIPLMVQQSRNAMQGLAAVAKNTREEFEVLGDEADKAGKKGGRAIGGSGGISQALRDSQRQAQELASLLDRLYPEEAARRQNLAEQALLKTMKDRVEVERALLALSLERSQVEWDRRDAEFRRVGQMLEVDPLAKTGEAFDNFLKRQQDLIKKTGAMRVQIAKTFKDMADDTIASLNRMASAIKGGGFLGILEALIGLGLQLGSIGAFGKKIQSNINRVPAYAGGTSFHPGGWAMVGEQGPELVSMPRGSAVTPNHDLNTQTVIRVQLSDDLNARIVEGAGRVVLETAPAIINRTKNEMYRDMHRPRLGG